MKVSPGGSKGAKVLDVSADVSVAAVDESADLSKAILICVQSCLQTCLSLSANMSKVVQKNICSFRCEPLYTLTEGGGGRYGDAVFELTDHREASSSK